MVERALADHDVARGIDVRPGVEEHLFVVVHVHVGVHDDDALGEAQHPGPRSRASPSARGPGSSCGSRRCSSCGTRQRREVVVDDLRHRRRTAWREDPLGRLAKARRPPAAACRRRSTGRSRRAASSSPSGGNEGKRLGRRVVAGVVSEGASVRARPSRYPRARSRRSLDLPKSTVTPLTSSTGSPRKPGEHELVDVLRQRRACGVRRDRVEPERNGHRDAPVGGEPVGAPVLVDLPVHERRAPVDLPASGTCRRCARRCAGRG